MIGLVAVLVGTTAVVRADFSSAMNAAMAPYYSALIASDRGDAESTHRNLVILSLKWEQVAREEPPAAIKADPQWPGALERVRRIIERTQELVRARNLDKAHLELEGLRLVLRDMRGRHNLLVLDDRLTDYHESLERIHVRASMQNEIVLADADFAEMSKDLVRAKAYWSAVEREAGTVAAAPGWAKASGRLHTTHAELEVLLARKDPAAVAQAADRMSAAYHELLEVLAKTPRE